MAGVGAYAARGARSGHGEGKVKAALAPRTAFLGSGSGGTRGGGDRPERRGAEECREAALPGLPLESERRLSASPHPHSCGSFDSPPTSPPTCPTLPALPLTPRLPASGLPAPPAPCSRSRALFPAPPGTVISLTCLSSFLGSEARLGLPSFALPAWTPGSTGIVWPTQ